MARLASCSATLVGSATRMGGGLPARDPAEHGSDGHAEAGQVALAEDVAGHDLAGRPQVLHRAAVLHQHPRALVDADAQAGEGDAGAQRVAQEGRGGEGPGPVRLGRGEPRGGAIVEGVAVEAARLHGGVELLDRRLERAGVEPEGAGQLRERAGADRREHRRHEEALGLGVDDAIGDLARLLRDEAAPDRVALRPQVLALVVEAGARASMATASQWVGSPTEATPWSSRLRRMRPRAYGVPRMRKFSAASPQYSLSHSILPWNPPDEATTEVACTVSGKPLLLSTASCTRRFWMMRDWASVSYRTSTPRRSAVR